MSKYVGIALLWTGGVACNNMLAATVGDSANLEHLSFERTDNNTTFQT